jgi:hypothetical protein
MLLEIQDFDARSHANHDVIDKETGKSVGTVRSGGSPSGGCYVSLFGGKYRKSLSNHAECWCFAKGVETVLNHMNSTDNLLSASEAA